MARSGARSCRLTYADAKRSRASSALYYFKQKSDDIATVELNPPPPGVQRDSDNNKVDNKSWAPSRNGLTTSTTGSALTAGARYTEDDKGSFPDQFDYCDARR